MTNPTSNFGWQMPESTDLVTNLPADFEVFGQAVDTDFADLNGGTTGQVLSKTSNTDLDFTWVAPTAGDIEGVTAGIGISGGGTSGTVTVTNSMATAIDAKGDLVVGTGADAFSRLAVGANTYTLVADSAEATGLKWQAPASGGGKVLQVVQATYDTETTTSSTSYVDTGLTATITPSLNTSKVLVMVSQPLQIRIDSSTAGEGSLNLVRGATEIVQRSSNSFAIQGASGTLVSRQYTSTTFLDSPATTSATTYKTQMRLGSLGTSIRSSVEGATKSTATIILMEIGA